MLRLRTRMAITALAASATALIAVLLLVGPGLRQRATDHEREALFAEARLMARVVEAPLARAQVEHIQRRITHREKATRQSLERQRRAFTVGLRLQRKLADHLDRAIGMDHEVQAWTHQREAADLDTPEDYQRLQTPSNPL